MADIVKYVARRSPKQTAIVDALRKRILSGRLRPGRRLPTLTDIEAEFGTSNLTVQRAIARLRDTGYIVTRGRAGTFVSDSPPHLCHFGIVFPESPSSNGQWSQFYVAVKHEATRAAAELSSGSMSNTTVSFFCSDRQEDRRKLLSLAQTEQFAGLIFPGSVTHLNGTAITAQEGLPRVLINWDAEPIPGFVAVRLDYEALFDKALRYFAERGRRKVAMMAASFHCADPGRLAEVFPEYVRKHGLTTRSYWMQGVDIGCPTWARASAELLAHCAPADRPDALLIVDDNLVQPATEGLRAAGVRAPQDMDIVGHATFPHTTPSALPIRRIGFAVPEMLRTSVDIIQRLRRGEEIKPQTVKALFDDELPESYSAPASGVDTGSRTDISM